MLGVSIYPEKGKKEDILNYLTDAASCGFTRVFSCLLSVEGSKEDIKKEFLEINTHATNLGMSVTLDVAPNIFDKLEISYDDLTFFKELGATSIRLDLGFDGKTEANITYNPHDLDIEINMSNNVNYVDLIMDYVPRRGKLIASHNFYPQKNTGLTEEHFTSCLSRFKKHGINTAAFINSDTATLGPWPHMDGLCSLESHRYIDSVAQLKHMYMLRQVDDILIGTMYASKEELQALGNVDPDILEFRVKVEGEITDYERAIVFDEIHNYRGDFNASFARCTESRLKYTDKIEVIENNGIDVGDVIICNKNMGQYNGELQIAKIAQSATNEKNVVVKIVEQEVFLLKLLKPWQKIKFIEV